MQVLLFHMWVAFVPQIQRNNMLFLLLLRYCVCWQVWAMLEYMDDVLGRLFDYIQGSAFKEDTYVMVMSDNGSEMFLGELPKRRVSDCVTLLPPVNALHCGCYEAQEVPQHALHHQLCM
jgi:arylsulfatase A-like enzyme